MILVLKMVIVITVMRDINSLFGLFDILMYTPFSAESYTLTELRLSSPTHFQQCRYSLLPSPHSHPELYIHGQRHIRPTSESSLESPPVSSPATLGAPPMS